MIDLEKISVQFSEKTAGLSVILKYLIIEDSINNQQSTTFQRILLTSSERSFHQVIRKNCIRGQNSLKIFGF